MTDTEINNAIAEACGWQRGRLICDGEWVWRNQDGQSRGQICIPDYVHDLNAMHEAEWSLSKELHGDYTSKLGSMAQKDGQTNAEFHMRYVCSPARYRAQAFLRVNGIWKD